MVAVIGTSDQSYLLAEAGKKDVETLNLGLNLLILLLQVAGKFWKHLSAWWQHQQSMNAFHIREKFRGYGSGAAVQHVCGCCRPSCMCAQAT